MLKYPPPLAEHSISLTRFVFISSLPQCNNDGLRYWVTVSGLRYRFKILSEMRSACSITHPNTALPLKNQFWKYRLCRGIFTQSSDYGTVVTVAAYNLAESKSACSIVPPLTKLTISSTRFVFTAVP